MSGDNRKVCALSVESRNKVDNEADVVLRASSIVRFYWLVRPLEGEPASWRIFIGVNQTDIKPEWITINGIVFIGVEQAVFVLNSADGKLLTQVTDLTFVQSLETGDSGQVLISAEDQFLVLSPKGDLMWKINLPSIIEEASQEGDSIRIKDSDGTVYLLNAETGEPIS